MTIGERRLYLCTPDRPDLAGFIQACVAGGVDMVQLREKHLSPTDLLPRATLAARVCSDLGVPFILNDFPDLALDCGADGVHVGQDDADPADARAVVGGQRIVGLSTHQPSELKAALDEPVDYISVGPVVPTPTKPGRPGTGLGYVTEAAKLCSERDGVRPEIPFFVTGNARRDTVEAIVKAGGRRVVVVRWLTEAADPRRAAAELSKELDRAFESEAQT
ncbi:MAG: thiamine phosphate synthase [Acidimicrobiales bacterium]